MTLRRLLRGREARWDEERPRLTPAQLLAWAREHGVDGTPLGVRPSQEKRRYNAREHDGASWAQRPLKRLRSSPIAQRSVPGFARLKARPYEG